MIWLLNKVWEVNTSYITIYQNCDYQTIKYVKW